MHFFTKKTLVKDISKDSIPFFYGYFIQKKDLVNILDQLGTLLISGISIIDALVIITEQSESFILKRLFYNITQSVKRGLLLSQAMERQKQFFPNKWVQLIKIGEYSGQLAEILVDLAAEEEKQIQLKDQLKSAMAYPVFILFLTLSLLAYMLLIVVPEIHEMYSKMQQSLPTPTLIIIDISTWLQEYIIQILVVSMSFFITIHIASQKIIYVKKYMDFIFLRMPIFGSLQKNHNIALFSGNLSMLLKSGVNITDALVIVQTLLPSTLYQNNIQKIIDGVNRGSKISQTLGMENLKEGQFKKNFYFPIQVIQMIRIGEETENLVVMLQKIKKNTMSHIDIRLKTLSSLLEPIMIVGVGLTVGIILLSVMLPFFSLKV